MVLGNAPLLWLLRCGQFADPLPQVLVCIHVCILFQNQQFCRFPICLFVLKIMYRFGYPFVRVLCVRMQFLEGENKVEVFLHGCLRPCGLALPIHFVQFKWSPAASLHAPSTATQDSPNPLPQSSTHHTPTSYSCLGGVWLSSH